MHTPLDQLKTGSVGSNYMSFFMGKITKLQLLFAMYTFYRVGFLVEV